MHCMFMASQTIVMDVATSCIESCAAKGAQRSFVARHLRVGIAYQELVLFEP